jgi:hypothetical protein
VGASLGGAWLSSAKEHHVAVMAGQTGVMDEFWAVVQASSGLGCDGMASELEEQLMEAAIRPFTLGGNIYLWPALTAAAASTGKSTDPQPAASL